MRPRLDAIAAFGLAAAFAVAQRWTLPEFCWSTWLAGLVFAWACVLAGGLHIVLTARSSQAKWARRAPFVERLPPAAFAAGITGLVAGLAWLAFHVYGFVFALYGLMLSFFAEMEPHALFGRNGFINADFFEAVAYLLAGFWPIAAGTLVANRDALLRTEPWMRMLAAPATELVRVHVLVVVMPFIALAAWALVGDAYHSVTIVLLLGVFFLLPARRPVDGARADAA